MQDLKLEGARHYEAGGLCAVLRLPVVLEQSPGGGPEGEASPGFYRFNTFFLIDKKTYSLRDFGEKKQIL